MPCHHYLKIIITTIIILLLPAISHAATKTTKSTPFATRSGFYLGAEFGSSFVDYKKSQFNATEAANIQSIKSSGFSEHINAGFIFNKYFNGELMVNYVFKPTFYFKSGPDKTTKQHFRNNIIALLARANIPLFSPRWLLMSKLGFGYVARQGLIDPTRKQKLLRDQEYFRPVYSLGIDWRISQHWDMTASWLQAAPLSSAKLPATQFVGAGFYYRWK